MRTRTLVQLEIEELSLVYAPNSPVVRGAVVVVAKGKSFLEDPGTLEVLRQLDKVVEGLKRDAQLRKEQEAAAQARQRTPKRYRTRTYEQFEDLADLRNREQDRRTLYDRCAESARPMLDPTGKPYRTIAPELF